MVEQRPGWEVAALRSNDAEGGGPESSQGRPAHPVYCPLVPALYPLAPVPGELSGIQHCAQDNG